MDGSASRGVIHGAGPLDPALGIEPPPGTLITQRGDRLHLCVAAWPLGHLHVKGGLAGKVRFARLLHDCSEINHSVIQPGPQGSHTDVDGIGPDVATLSIPPITRPDVLLPVIEIRLDVAAEDTEG